MKYDPHPFGLRQLQYVLAVAEHLSFRKAAAAARVAQPSLSAQIGALERSLGTKLFERDRRRVLLTAAGRIFVERARRLLNEADDLVAVAAAGRDPLEGTLTIGVIPTISPYLLPTLTPALRKAHPELRVRWIEKRTEALAIDLASGDLDAVLLALEAELGDVEKAVIARDPFVLVAARATDPIEATKLATIAELRGAEVLLLDDGHCLGKQALELCSRAKACALEFRATSLTTIAQMVAGGAGVTLLPELSLDLEARPANLRVRRFADPAPGRTIGLVWRPTSPFSKAMRRLAATIRAAYPASNRKRLR